MIRAWWQRPSCRVWLLGLCFFLIVMAPRGVLAACDCVLEDSVGVVWHGDNGPGLDEIAHLLAPILWFSPDEPLLRQGRVIPAAHPCDTPAAGPVVYYQVSSLVNRGEKVSEPLEADSLFFKKVRFMRLRYFLYYPADIGAHGHRHDVEGVELEVRLHRDSSGCATVRLQRALGFAHGVPLYDNRLRITDDTRLPVTLLVEEGKHASCPDRNWDGSYTPGYDINERVNDGWGVRDIFGSGRLLGGGYRAAMTKGRHEATRLFPPATALVSPCPLGARQSQANQEPSLGHYELRPGQELKPCSGLGTAAESTFFVRGMMVSNGFGASARPTQRTNPVTPNLTRFDDPEKLRLGFAVRFDEGNAILSASLLGHDVGEGWLVPRVGLGSTMSAELLFTPSATAWTCPYFSAGWEWRDRRTESIGGVQTEIEPANDSFVSELGYKFRLGLPQNALRLLFLGYRFGGIRVGTRFNGIREVRNIRITASIGAGVF